MSPNLSSKAILNHCFPEKRFKRNSRRCPLSGMLPETAGTLRDLQSNPPWTFSPTQDGHSVCLYMCRGFMRCIDSKNQTKHTPKTQTSMSYSATSMTYSAVVALLPDLDYNHGLARGLSPSVSLSYPSCNISQVVSCDHNLFLKNHVRFLPAASSTWRSKP